MAYSGDPNDSKKDEVRHLTGDTSNKTSQEFLSDKEIEFELAKVSDNVTAAAANCADRIRARVFPRVDYRMHGVTVNGSQLRQAMRDLAENLRSGNSLAGSTPVLTGVSKAEREAQVTDTDLRHKSFEVGMHDHGGTETLPRS